MATDKPLSKKHQKFINEYLKCFNGTQAYMAVYPKASYDTARANAATLLAKTSINAEIQSRLNEQQMGVDEALKLTADIARGDIAELMDISSVGFNLDMEEAKKKGLTKLIKKVKQKTTTIIGKKESDDDKEITELEIELYPADAALERILKILGKLKEPGLTVYNVTISEDE